MGNPTNTLNCFVLREEIRIYAVDMILKESEYGKSYRHIVLFISLAHELAVVDDVVAES